jgi:curved DNA-binding protein CbpA
MNDLYEVLQVRQHAEPEVIRAAYRALARKHHPDFGGKPDRMAAINEAWAVLGNPTRRAAYDTTPHAVAEQDRTGTVHASVSQTPQAPPAPQTGGLAGRRHATAAQGGSVLDFGRYTGWTVASLADHDPDYLEWLARVPIGRRLSNEIQEALARRASETASLRPAPKPAQKRGFSRPWTASRASR